MAAPGHRPARATATGPTACRGCAVTPATITQRRRQRCVECHRQRGLAAHEVAPTDFETEPPALLRKLEAGVVERERVDPAVDLQRAAQTPVTQAFDAALERAIDELHLS